MQFTYTYRSSDGQRHSANIEAENRDAAFAKVRAELGIKPIKMTAVAVSQGQDTQDNRDAQDRRREPVLGVVGVFAILALLAFGAWWWLTGRAARPKATPYQAGVRVGAHRDGTNSSVAVGLKTSAVNPAFTNLAARAEALELRQKERTARLNLDLLHNYALIRRLADLSELYEEIDKGRQIVDETRADAREIFGGIYETFPAECANERIEAEKLYDALMSAVDAVEQRLDDEEEALVLLDDNRDKWDVQAGRLIFTDKRLEREFKFYDRPTEATSIRWRRDFGHRSIESAPVALPVKGK